MKKPTERAATRKEIALRHVRRDGPGVEIGPSHSPLAPKSEGFKVHIIDHMSREGLLHKYKPHPVDLSRIEDVDFVWRGESYAQLTGRRDFYDWIIAAHVIEHTPDFISFLASCDEILKDDGVLSLIVPDKRYCFDRFRPITGLARIIDGHISQSAIHSPGSVVEYFMNVISKGGEGSWDPHTIGNYRFFHTPAEAKEGMRLVLEEKAYLGIHNWCFVPHSLRLILDDLFALGFTRLREVDFTTTRGHEFFVTLGRQGAGPRTPRLDMLRAIDAELAASDMPSKEIFGAAVRSVFERLRKK